MNVYARIGLWMGVFFVVDGAVYAYTGHEWEGFPLLLMTAGGLVLVALYARRRFRRALRPAEADGPEPGEPHVGPTIWPFVFAISAIGVTVGLLAAKWVLVLGAVVFAAAAVGWFRDIRGQWAHDAGALYGGHGDGGQPGSGDSEEVSEPTAGGGPRHELGTSGSADGPSG